jgi:hypothetical protein
MASTRDADDLASFRSTKVRIVAGKIRRRSQAMATASFFKGHA